MPRSYIGKEALLATEANRNTEQTEIREAILSDLRDKFDLAENA